MMASFSKQPRRPQLESRPPSCVANEFGLRHSKPLRLVIGMTKSPFVRCATCKAFQIAGTQVLGPLGSLGSSVRLFARLERLERLCVFRRSGWDVNCRGRWRYRETCFDGFDDLQLISLRV